MKKFILILLTIALVLGLTSCSQEVYSKIAEITGSMKNNAWGIEANTSQVDAASAKLDSSIQRDEDGKATGVKLSDAASIIGSVAEVKGSEQKVEALKAELAKPVAETDEDKAVIKGALETELASVSSDLDTVIAATTGEAKQVLESVKAALDAIEISENPTKAELATVAVLNQIATKTQELATSDPEDLITSEGLTEAGLETVDLALGALDTLKVVSEVASIDLLGDIDLTTIMSSFRGVSRADDDTEKYLQIANVTVSKLIGFVTEDGKFNDAKYASFIAQCKAIKATYDLITAPYLAGAKTPADEDGNKIGSISGIFDLFEKEDK